MIIAATGIVGPWPLKSGGAEDTIQHGYVPRTGHLGPARMASKNEVKGERHGVAILEVDEPQFNHNGGQITFGPDGFLYILLGDGGAGNDRGLGHSPLGNGQDLATLLARSCA